MATFWRILLSILVLFVAMLVAAAGTELMFGEAKPGLVPLILIVIAGPVLYLIWRRRQGKNNA